MHAYSSKLPILLSLAVLTMAASSEADVVMRKRIRAHFPDQSWCPFNDEYDFGFVATTDRVDVIFDAPPEDLAGGGVEVGNVLIVPESVFANGFRAWDDIVGDEGCWQAGAPFFATSASSPGIVDLMGSAAQWTLVNAELSGGSLFLGVDRVSRTSAKATVTGLTPGARYFVTGWSSWEFDGTVNVKVDTPRPPAFSLQNGRFKLELRHDGSQLAGGQVLSDRSAVFWFRDSLKTEMIINVVDRCADKGAYFVFVAGTTATQVSVTITDVQKGKKVSYKTKQGERFPSKVDQTTFRCQS